MHQPILKWSTPLRGPARQVFQVTFIGKAVQIISLCTAFFIIRALIAGGGAPEIEVSIRLAEHARTLTGMEAYCVRAFAEALEIIPYTLSENAGLNPIATVTELRNRHAQGETTAGINVRKVTAGSLSPTFTFPKLLSNIII